MERLHLEGEFNHHYSAVDKATLRGTVKRFYRRFYLRPGYLLKMLSRIRNPNMLRNAIIGGVNVVTFSMSQSEG